jgi:tetratricopeptide (TPR) repeat protein
VASTSKPAAVGRHVAGSAPTAASYAEEAEGILGRVLTTARGPTRVAVDRFVEGGGLERVLALYTRAMRAEPSEAAYPWNLASSLDRLGLSDLALSFVARAVRIAEEQGDDEFGGVHAHIAWAEIAINAHQPELAGVLLRHARQLDPNVPVERYERKLRARQGAAVAEPAPNQDSARKGAAVEHLIAAHCMLASNLELNVSTTLVDDEGVDLVFHRRGSPTTLAVQVKSRSWSASTMQRNQSFVSQVRAETFQRRRDLYMLFVAVDPRFGEYGPVWFVGSEAFADIVQPNQRNRLRFAASANPSSRDRWSRYRLERSQLPARILEELTTLHGSPER